MSYQVLENTQNQNRCLALAIGGTALLCTAIALATGLVLSGLTIIEIWTMINWSHVFSITLFLGLIVIGFTALHWAIKQKPDELLARALAEQDILHQQELTSAVHEAKKESFRLGQADGLKAAANIEAERKQLEQKLRTAEREITALKATAKQLAASDEEALPPNAVPHPARITLRPVETAAS